MRSTTSPTILFNPLRLLWTHSQIPKTTADEQFYCEHVPFFRDNDLHRAAMEHRRVRNKLQRSKPCPQSNHESYLTRVSTLLAHQNSRFAEASVK